MTNKNNKIPKEGMTVEDITLEQYEDAKTFYNVRQACTLQYNELATAEEPGDSIVFSSDTKSRSVTLTFDAAQKALESTNQENMDTYGIPNKEIKIGIEDSPRHNL